MVTKSIAVKQETLDKLRSLKKHPRASYEEVILEMIRLYETDLSDEVK